jgi:hypothetical protein
MVDAETCRRSAPAAQPGDRQRAPRRNTRSPPGRFSRWRGQWPDTWLRMLVRIRVLLGGLMSPHRAEWQRVLCRASAGRDPTGDSARRADRRVSGASPTRQSGSGRATVLSHVRRVESSRPDDVADCRARESAIAAKRGRRTTRQAKRTRLRPRVRGAGGSSTAPKLSPCVSEPATISTPRLPWFVTAPGQTRSRR